jgi:hypothetical protein
MNRNESKWKLAIKINFEILKKGQNKLGIRIAWKEVKNIFTVVNGQPL